MSFLARKLVSKQKRRFTENGFDLDLTFAMYPFDDHNAPPMELFKAFCDDVKEWLEKDSRNVAVVHCKAGKGRTGVMICAYLMYSGKSKTAEESLEFYGSARTKNKKGVTIPSQKRYVNYFEELLRVKMQYIPRLIFFTSIKFRSLPKLAQGFNPIVVVKQKETRLFSTKPLENAIREGREYEVVFPVLIPVCGDIKVEVYNRETFGKEKLCHFWFNTFFIKDFEQVFMRTEIDKANKDKHGKVFDDKFGVVLKFMDPDSVAIQPEPLPDISPTSSLESEGDSKAPISQPNGVASETAGGLPAALDRSERNSHVSSIVTMQSPVMEDDDDDEVTDESDDDLSSSFSSKSIAGPSSVHISAE